MPQTSGLTGITIPGAILLGGIINPLDGGTVPIVFPIPIGDGATIALFIIHITMAFTGRIGGGLTGGITLDMDTDSLMDRTITAYALTHEDPCLVWPVVEEKKALAVRPTIHEQLLTEGLPAKSPVYEIPTVQQELGLATMQDAI